MQSNQHVASATYYDDLTRIGAYFSAATEPLGKWLGSGAKALGLSGTVIRDDLEKLAAGFSPADKPLVQNAGKKLEEHKSGGHRPGWDLTFSAPKSVSVLWATAGPDVRAIIESCHDDAVVATLAYIEAQCGWSRRGKGGRFFERAKLVIAAYQHGTSRALDPQLHTHAFVLNIGVSPDGKTRALHSQEFYKWKMTTGKFYQNQLAHNLQTRLGLPIRVTPHGCEVAGVSSRVTAFFSKRREAIQAKLIATGRHSAKAAEAAALDTRPAKSTAPREALHQSWREIAKTRFGFGQRQIENLRQQERQQPMSQAALADLIRQSIEKLLVSKAHFTTREILRDMLHRAIGRGVSSTDVTKAVDDHLALSPEIVRLQERNLERHYTTRDTLILEKQVIETAQKLARDESFQVSRSVIERVLKSRPGILARTEQRRAVEDLLKPGRLKLLTGMPGTGKTFVLDALREALEKSGYKCLGTAVAGKAVRGLSEQAHMKGVTVEKLIRDLASTPAGALRHHAKQLVKAALGKPTERLERIALGPRSVVIIDEASMLDTVQTHKILQEADRRGAKVILVGDPQQLPAIGAGSPFQGLLARHEHASLVTIERQRDPSHVAAIHDLARNDSRQFVERIHRGGLLTIGNDRRDTLTQLTSDWRKHGGTGQPEAHRIFVGTNADRIAANDACQKMRLDAQPRTATASLTIRSRQDLEGRKPIVVGEDFYVGDPVMCLQRNKRLEIENGTLGIVTAVDRLARTLTLRICGAGKARSVELPLAKYPHLTRAYAQTTHKAQGETVENAYVLFGGAMQSRELTYVQASRAKGVTRYYADQFDCGEGRKGLVSLLSRSAAKQLAHDLLEQPTEVIKPLPVRESIPLTNNDAETLRHRSQSASPTEKLRQRRSVHSPSQRKPPGGMFNVSPSL